MVNWIVALHNAGYFHVRGVLLAAVWGFVEKGGQRADASDASVLKDVFAFAGEV